jgi:ABC-type amino acid transport system permease subunit
MKKKRIISFIICAVILASLAACLCLSVSAAEAGSSAPSGSWIEDMKAQFDLNFIQKDRWKSLLTGLGNTLQITIFAALIGVAIGIVIAAIRTTYDNNKENMKHNKSIGYYILGFFNGISKIYLTVIRGTPVVVQLLIIYFIIFASSNNDIMIATLAFGINSGAYVAEILRGGIMSIDKGQFEAGRSIGFNYVQTMYYIIIPQVLKNVLPTLLNEFIALLKETSVAGYVGVVDLTRAGNAIRGATFSAFMPLIAVALIYLIIVLVLTWIVGIIERRLRKSER